jgi:hypothetical protein
MRRPLLLCSALGLAGCAGQSDADDVAIDSDDIDGVVSGVDGPEGVWVTAETRELPTRLAKIVVTNDQGRYVIPDLPSANYRVWVRGYGLVDSPMVQAKPGQAKTPPIDRHAIPAQGRSARGVART